MDETELRILQTLDAIIRQESLRSMIDSKVLQAEEKLVRHSELLLAWEPIPMDVYDKGLPSPIRSSWVFVLRAGAKTGAERHPNSHQRMMSYRGSGDFQVQIDGKWCSNILTSNPTAPIERRWISIPPDTWHQAVVAERNWVVVSFHTVSEDELIEERPDSDNHKSISRRRYTKI